METLKHMHIVTQHYTAKSEVQQKFENVEEDLVDFPGRPSISEKMCREGGEPVWKYVCVCGSANTQAPDFLRFCEKIGVHSPKSAPPKYLIEIKYPSPYVILGTTVFLVFRELFDVSLF